MMRIIGNILIAVGILALLKNVGMLRFIDWAIIWPVAIIILGISTKSCKGMTADCFRGMMGKCDKKGMCGGDEHKCEGMDCGECKK